MNQADKIDMDTLNGLFDGEPPDDNPEAYGLNLTAARRLVVLQRQWIDELENRLTRIEPVVKAATRWLVHHGTRNELDGLLQNVIEAVDAAGRLINHEHTT